MTPDATTAALPDRTLFRCISREAARWVPSVPGLTAMAGALYVLFFHGDLGSTSSLGRSRELNEVVALMLGLVALALFMATRRPEPSGEDPEPFPSLTKGDEQ